jgi:hypothetical protein
MGAYSMDLTELEISKIKAWLGWPLRDTTVDPYCKGLTPDQITVVRDYIARIDAAMEALDTASDRGNIKRAEEVEFFGPSGLGAQSAAIRRLLAMLSTFLGVYALTPHFGNSNCMTRLG